MIYQIGEQLRRAREKKGWSQKELGERVKVAQGHISKIERGEVDIRLSTLQELARNLDMEASLIPRQLVPVLAALERGKGPETPLYSLDEEENE